MKKAKKIIWIPILVVAIIAVVVIALSFIKVNPILDNFDGYSRIELLQSSSGSEYPHITEDGVDLTAKTLNEGIKTTNFSIMQAILEGKFSYKLKAKTTKVKEDGKEVTKDVTVDAATINSYGAAQGEYILKLYYDKTQTLTVGDKTIKYDMLLVRISESEGEIKDMDCVPYLYYNVNNNSLESEYDEEGRIGSFYYSTNVFTVKMKTSKFMLRLQELLDTSNR